MPFDLFAVWKETPLSANSVKPGMLHRISCLNHEHLLRVRHNSSVKRLTAKRRRDFFLGSDNKGTKKTCFFPQKNREKKETLKTRDVGTKNIELWFKDLSEMSQPGAASLEPF